MAKIYEIMSLFPCMSETVKIFRGLVDLEWFSINLWFWSYWRPFSFSEVLLTNGIISGITFLNYFYTHGQFWTLLCCLWPPVLSPQCIISVTRLNLIKWRPFWFLSPFQWADTLEHGIFCKYLPSGVHKKSFTLLSNL